MRKILLALTIFTAFSTVTFSQGGLKKDDIEAVKSFKLGNKKLKNIRDNIPAADSAKVDQVLTTAAVVNLVKGFFNRNDQIPIGFGLGRDNLGRLIVLPGEVRGAAKFVSTTTNYTVVPGDHYLVFPEPAAVRSINFPAASTMQNETVIIQSATATANRWILNISMLIPPFSTVGAPDNFVNSGLGENEYYEIHSTFTGTGWRWVAWAPPTGGLTGGGLTTTNFVNKQVPSGLVNGTNTAFTLSSAPLANSDDVYINGILQDRGLDYTIAGATINFLAAPTTGDQIRVNYIKAN